MRNDKDLARGRSVAIIGTRGYPSYYGGFETAVRKLAPYLAEQGWDVTVYGRPGSTRIDDPSIDERINIVTTKGVNNRSLSTLSFGLSSSVHALLHKPDVALVMNVANGFWLPLLRARGIPSLVNVDGIEWQRAKWGRLAKGMFRWGARFTARFGNELIFDAKAIEAFWNREFGRDGTFIPYGGEPVGDLELEDGLQTGEYVLMVARFVPENTIAEFFEAAEELASAGIVVVIVGSTGSGGEFDELARSLDEKHPTIHWLGHVSDDRRLFALWQHTAAYFHGHSVGGTNPALVQAMACGAPVIARDTVYNREVLGSCGVLVAPEPNAIVAAARELLEDRSLGLKLGAMARERASTSYSWHTVCVDYERALSEILPEQRSPRAARGSHA